MVLELDNFWFGIIPVCRPLPKQNLRIEIVDVITNRLVRNTDDDASQQS